MSLLIHVDVTEKTMFKRYAIFYTLPHGAFAEFCAAWLGWDSRSGTIRSHPTIKGLDVGALTKVPRKYGFHGTLKAPFRMSEGRNPDELVAALRMFVTGKRPATLQRMVIQHHHGFLALRPEGDVGALRTLAGDIVLGFDHFRDPPTEKELARRRKAGLTRRQDDNMMKWGYPYVMDDFHFHMTLSGPIDAAIGQTIAATLGPQLMTLIPQPFVIDHLSLMAEDRTGYFHEIHRCALTG